MAQSIKFDGTEILNTTYTPRFIKHESSPERMINLLDLSRDNGSIIISDKYGTKKITVQGYLVGSSKADLEAKIDTFKELFSRKEKILRIDWGNTNFYRSYIATCTRHDFDRDHFNILFVPWTAEFVVPSGIGEAESETALITNYNWLGYSDYSPTVVFGGSAPPKPRITLAFLAGVSDLFGLSIKNNTTGDEMVITSPGGFQNGNTLEIDCRLKTVKYGGVAASFYKMFPSFIVGSNSLTFKSYRIISQEASEFGSNIPNIIYGDKGLAMSFITPNTDETYRAIALYMLKHGTLNKDLLASIQTDNEGAPSGTDVSGATFAIAHAGVGSGYSWQYGSSAANFTLSANTKYWIVTRVEDFSGDINNYYALNSLSGTDAIYKKGNMATSVNMGDVPPDWTDVPTQDMSFRLMYGGYGTEDANVSINYYPQYL